MFKSVLAAALLVGAGLVGATSSAEAHWRHGHCCGPFPTVHSSHTVFKVSHVTRFHDEWRRHVVHRPQLYVNTTRVQKIVYVNDVLRVHHQTVEVARPVHVSRVEWLPERVVVTHSVVGINEGCVRY